MSTYLFVIAVVINLLSLQTLSTGCAQEILTIRQVYTVLHVHRELCVKTTIRKERSLETTETEESVLFVKQRMFRS